MFKDYYAILEITYPSDADTVKNAYRKLSKKWHPDLNPGRDTDEEMKAINEAYEIFKDPVKKERYDREYIVFRQKQSQTSSSTSYSSSGDTNSQDKGDTTHSRRWNYDYDVKDEKVREDIFNARRTAEDYVREFKDSLRKTSKSAIQGAWNEMRAYVIIGIVATIIALMAGMCSSGTADGFSVDVPTETTEPKEAKVIKVLDKFSIPSSWTTYSVDNNSFSISVPSTVELRHDYDQYTKMLNSNNINYNADQVVFQQKGLSSSSSNNYDEHYCRIMLSHSKDSYGDYLKSTETEELDIETISVLRTAVLNQLGPTQKLVGSPSYSWIDINGTKAIEIQYRRTGNNGNTTKCTIYYLFNNNEMVQMIIAYRESEANFWAKDINNIIKTFKWK